MYLFNIICICGMTGKCFYSSTSSIWNFKLSYKYKLHNIFLTSRLLQLLCKHLKVWLNNNFNNYHDRWTKQYCEKSWTFPGIDRNIRYYSAIFGPSHCSLMKSYKYRGSTVFRYADNVCCGNSTSGRKLCIRNADDEWCV